MLDTLKARHDLIEVGFDEKQAEVIVRIEQQKQDEVATKDFVDKKIAEVKTEIAEVKTDLKTEIEKNNTKIEKVNTKVDFLIRFLYPTILIIIGGLIKLIFFSDIS